MLGAITAHPSRFRSPSLGKKLQQLVSGHVDVSQDLAQNAGAERFPTMHRHHGRTAVWVLQDNVAAALASDAEPGAAESVYDLASSNRR
jgi:hypothetical protein